MTKLFRVLLTRNARINNKRINAGEKVEVSELVAEDLYAADGIDKESIEEISPSDKGQEDEALTVPQLKEALKEKGVEFKSDAKKADLEALLAASE